jgi:endo-1,4-beta-xylanase
MGTLGMGRSKYLSYQIEALDDPKRDFTAVGEASLKERAAAKGLIYGAAMRYPALLSDAKLANCFVRECGILVPEWGLKWYVPGVPLRPNPDKFDFTEADWMAQFAKTNSLLYRGHTLVWHESLPPWFKDTVNSQNAEQVLVKHIKTVAGRYAGKMHSWDVVNEAIATYENRQDNLRKTPWLELLGPNYIDTAFRVAADTDPKALLVYNDFGLEYDTPEDEAKRTAVLKLLERLKSKGTPVQALGIQAHLLGGETRFNSKKLREFFSNVASMGLKILITELDVTDKNLPKNTAVRDRIVAASLEDYLAVALDEPAVIAVLTWGLSDRVTWLSDFQSRSDGAAVRPLPMDADLKPKLAWNAIARALDSAPKR